jgi:hypothetical protein
MAKPLKEKGIDELEAFRLRVHRQYGLGRISGEAFQYLHDMTANMIGYVEDMEELDEKGDESCQ